MHGRTRYLFSILPYFLRPFFILFDLSDVPRTNIKAFSLLNRLLISDNSSLARTLLSARLSARFPIVQFFIHFITLFFPPRKHKMATPGSSPSLKRFQQKSFVYSPNQWLVRLPCEIYDNADTKVFIPPYSALNLDCLATQFKCFRLKLCTIVWMVFYFFKTLLSHARRRAFLVLFRIQSCGVRRLIL